MEVVTMVESSTFQVKSGFEHDKKKAPCLFKFTASSMT
eukprot:CAMPEP_0198568834 /NCGR_PEP_ID=MMETSP1462-20131121/107006_1 /TAXON_ID=1333877 /ORGANISM="Brandtodinium nutriculum, Strain RCC3387" /LENGTH=37 /DNA_ID= /DNA_START= /DNA_END= /DNA_ORIENTATION=